MTTKTIGPRETETLAAAWRAIQAEVEAPPLDGVNPHFRNKYTTLAAAISSIVPVANAHGVIVAQDVTTQITDGTLFASVTTELIHTSGEVRRYGPLLVPAQSLTAQHLAGAVTYGRRISLLSTFALAGEDDLDGEENRPHKGNGHASAPPPAAPKPAAKPVPAAPAAKPRPVAKPAAPDTTPYQRRERDDQYWVYETVISNVFSDPTTNGGTRTTIQFEADGARKKASTFDLKLRAKILETPQDEVVNLLLAPSRNNPQYTDLLDVESVGVSGQDVPPEPVDAEDGDDIPF